MDQQCNSKTLYQNVQPGPEAPATRPMCNFLVGGAFVAVIRRASSDIAVVALSRVGVLTASRRLDNFLRRPHTAASRPLRPSAGGRCRPDAMNPPSGTELLAILNLLRSDPTHYTDTGLEYPSSNNMLLYT